MVSIVPEPYVVAHIQRVETTNIDPDTGDPIVADMPVVLRRVQGISQVGQMRGSSRPVFSVEFLKRLDTALHISVADPSLYGPLDQVLLFAETDAGGAYVPGSGVAFVVQGIPIDARQSPWPLLTKQFGGTVEIKRIT